MPETYLFDVPIYWCSQKRFDSDYDRRLNEYLQDFESKTGYPLKEHLRISLTDGFWRSYVAPWRFNQVVGWIRLFRLGSQLRGDLWYMNAKRAGRQLAKKQLSLKGKAFELHVHPEESSDDICRNVLGDLESFAKTLRRSEVLDSECFKALAPFVNWRSLMDTQVVPNPSIERTATGEPASAAHIKR